jgi:hypothetical protein
MVHLHSDIVPSRFLVSSIQVVPEAWLSGDAAHIELAPGKDAMVMLKQLSRTGGFASGTPNLAQSRLTLSLKQILSRSAGSCRGRAIQLLFWTHVRRGSHSGARPRLLWPDLVRVVKLARPASHSSALPAFRTTLIFVSPLQ